MCLSVSRRLFVTSGVCSQQPLQWQFSVSNSSVVWVIPASARTFFMSVFPFNLGTVKPGDINMRNNYWTVTAAWLF